MDVESKIPAFLEAQRNLVKPVPPQNGQNGSSTPQSSPTQPGSKRKAPQFPEVSKAGGKKRKVAGGPVQAKNAVVTLNEYKAGLEYVMVEQRGPVHQPTFVIGVTVNGAQFLGEGGSKKLAKLAAAEMALKSFVQFKNPLEAQVAMGLAPTHINTMDFTSDTEIGQEMQMRPFNESNVSDISLDTSMNNSCSSIPHDNTTNKQAATPGDQNPVMTLNELKPGLSFDCAESGTSPATKRFTMKVLIDQQEFEGSGASKKQAKQAAARSALTKLYNINFTPMTTNTSTPGSASKVAGTDMLISEFSMDQSVADSIGRLILARYDELMVGLPQHSRRKVIAGIVMTRDSEMQKMEVISVSTGTKCVNGEFMSVSGTSINDCHAEIISRRCLMDYLYTQLEKVAMAKGQVEESSILIKAEEGGYQLRENVRFHLYINTAPCGDARIFSPHEAQPGEGSDRHPNRKARGQLRTKIESGEGTIPVKSSEGVQTWDGVLQGARLLTMSCSDKVCRWNVLGVQGSLLAYYLHPVYLHSVVLGSLFHPTHMFRALTGRIQTSLSPLPAMYKLHTPRLNLLSSAEVRQPGKAPNYSVNWTVKKEGVEVVDAMKGKEQDSSKASRLCKVAMFKRWLELAKCDELSRVEEVAMPVPSMYSEVKEGSKKFQTVKGLLFKAFKDAGLGNWVKKPMEQDEFEV
eukprot:GFUD01031960.1.p1 GENE.GFUD01031960.1~~GFUD01031960.1.p1  ORF type:complete len:688 (-),score=250.66 GFUD01031960.1:145-2208(-)